MLPDIGGLELLLIAIVALIVVGPKDLPIMLRKLGQFTGRLRAMANDFRASFDEMARQSELDELRKEVEAMRQGQLADMAALDASTAHVGQVFDEIGGSLGSAGAASPSPYDAASLVSQAEPVAEAPAKKPRKPRATPAGAAAAKPAAKPRAKRVSKPKTDGAGA
jgi:sec-independent protein translocase protein TatB